jgi:hypothetical protein
MTSEEQARYHSGGSRRLPNGCYLYWRIDPAVNAREYYSDEVGGGVAVWHTALVDPETLLAAVVIEAELRRAELEAKKWPTAIEEQHEEYPS